MEYFKTKDAEEAAFYWTMEDKFEFNRAEKQERLGHPIVWFVFKVNLDPADFEALRRDYLNGKCLVEPHRFSSKRAVIKRIIREQY